MSVLKGPLLLFHSWFGWLFFISLQSMLDYGQWVEDHQQLFKWRSGYKCDLQCHNVPLEQKMYIFSLFSFCQLYFRWDGTPALSKRSAVQTLWGSCLQVYWQWQQGKWKCIHRQAFCSQLAEFEKPCSVSHILESSRVDGHDCKGGQQSQTRASFQSNAFVMSSETFSQTYFSFKHTFILLLIFSCSFM